MFQIWSILCWISELGIKIYANILKLEKLPNLKYPWFQTISDDTWQGLGKQICRACEIVRENA